MTDECMVCAELSGAWQVPGGFIEQGEFATVFHSPVLPTQSAVYLGYLLVVANRHVAGFAGLSDAEAAAIGVAIARWSRALESLGPEHVYVARIGHAAPHLHINLLPRWPGTPTDVLWTEVDSWPGAKRGDASSASAVVSDLRALSDGHT